MQAIILCVLFIISGCVAQFTCEIKERGVSQHDIETIVGKHNYYRQQIAIGNVTGQPEASNMLKMMWDEQLAREAQSIADNCQFKHFKVKDPRFQVGQNLYTWRGSRYYPGAIWSTAITAWFNEVKTYEFNTKLNHYTQVVWARTNLVGCGYTYFNATTSKFLQKLYVCNYGPAGNYRGQPPYQIGPGCENLCTV